MPAESQFKKEILEQPEALARLLGSGGEAVAHVAEAVRAFAPAAVLIAARGSSDNAARYAQYLFGAHNRLAVGLAVPSLMTVYEAPPKLERLLVIGISQSGQSPDIVSVVAEGRRQGALTLAISNDVSSPLAHAAGHALALDAGREAAVAASKTYTNELLLLAMLSAALEGNPERERTLSEVPELVAQAIEKNADLGPLSQSFSQARQFVVLGRGFNYATAFEVSLKIKETASLIAEPYSFADLLHGPVAMIDQGFPVLIVAPSGLAQRDVPELLELLAARHARVLAISDQPEILARAEGRLRMPAGVPEWLSPIVGVVPGQLFASAFARARGLDPDLPRGLTKVTRTH